MSQVERGLFERIDVCIDKQWEDYHVDVDAINIICAEFEQRLAEAEKQLEVQRTFCNTSAKIAQDNLDKIAEVEHQRDKALDDYEKAMHRVSQLECYEEMVIGVCGELKGIEEYRAELRLMLRRSDCLNKALEILEGKERLIQKITNEMEKTEFSKTSIYLDAVESLFVSIDAPLPESSKNE